MSGANAPWRSTRLGDVAGIVRGVTYTKGDAQRDPRAGYLPLVRATNISSRLDFESELVYIPETLVQPHQRLASGDIILVASSGSLTAIGRSALVRTVPESTFGAFCMVIRPAGRILPEYLAYLLRSERVRGLWSENARGTNINNLKRGIVEETPVPLPSMDDQRRMVDIVEDHLSHLEGGMQEVSAAVAKAQILDLSAMSQVRRLLLDASVPQVPIGEACVTSLGKMLDAKRATGVATPYLRNINVRWRNFDLSGVKFVQLTPAEIERLQVLDGDILVCEGGEPGRCAVWAGGPQQMTFQKALHRVRVKDPRAMIPDYVALMIEENIKSGRADRLLTGTTIKHLPQEKLRLIEIPNADVKEQKEIANHLEQVFVARERMVADAVRLGNKCRSLREALLEAAFTGRLTGHDHDLQVVEEMAGV